MTNLQDKKYKLEITETEWISLSEIITDRIAYLEDIKSRYLGEVKTSKLQPREYVNSTRQRIFTYQKTIDDLNDFYNKVYQVVNNE